MRSLDIKDFEKKFEWYSFGRLQDFLVFVGQLEIHGYTFEDVKEYVETKKAEQEIFRKKFAVYKIDCPDCGNPLWMLPVNDKPSTQTGDDSKTVLLCRNTECLYTEFRTKTVNEIVFDLIKEHEGGN